MTILKTILLLLTTAILSTPTVVLAQYDEEVSSLKASDFFADDGSTLAYSFPEVLSDEDTSLYHAIFRQQNVGDWAGADKRIAKLSNDILVGHLLAERYLSNTYRSNYAELKEWMQKYYDHPQADRIYRLAVKKAGGNSKGLKTPTKRYRTVKSSGENKPLNMYNFYNNFYSSSYAHLSPENRAKAKQGVASFKKYVRWRRTLNAKNVLQDASLKKLYTKNDYLTMSGLLSRAYFLDRHYEFARLWGEEPAEAGIPIALWSMGLLEFKEGDFIKAKNYFKALGEKTNISDSIKASAYFWAARSNDKIDYFNSEKENSNAFLKLAAPYHHTFYGLLAAHALGDNPSYRWRTLDFDDGELRTLMQHPSGMRALALMHLAKVQRAQRELYNLFLEKGDDEKLMRTILGFAEIYNLANLQFRICQDGDSDRLGRYFDAVCYPAPEWKPRDGWKVDKALVYAIIRQESHFNTLARSSKKASGLMQLMPATASLIAKDKQLLSRKTNLLFEPEYNISIGQAYLMHLMEYDLIEGNLFMLLAAYNAGPGNAFKWYRNFDHDDPLLFMEAMPMGETRNYVQRVLANYWIYCDRFGLRNPSVNDLLANRWPTYNKP